MRSSRLRPDSTIRAGLSASGRSSPRAERILPLNAAGAGRWRSILLTALIAAAVLAPSVRLSSRLDGMRVELLAWVVAVPFLVSAWVVPAIQGTARHRGARNLNVLGRLQLGPIDAGFFALGLATLCSTLWAPLVLGEPAGLRDSFELVKLALYWIAFRTALLVAADESARRLTLGAFLAAGSVAALIALAQYVSPSGVPGRIGEWWAEAHHLRALERDGRAFGTAGNANYFGAMMAMLAIVALHVVGDRSSRVTAVRRLALIALALGSLGVVLSGSRGALGLLIAGMAVAWMVSATGAGGARRLLLPAAIASLAVVAAVAFVEAVPRGRDGYLARVAGAFDPGGDNAIALRLERWRGASEQDAARAGESGGSLLRNGDLERAAEVGVADFRGIPGTVYRRSSDAARSGSGGIVYRGSPDEPGRRAAVFQQRALGRRVDGPLTASVWVNLRPDARGEVLLYTNVLYGDGTRQDPHALVAADPSRGGDWQRLTVDVAPEPGRIVDFVGVYLLTDGFAGEVWVDDFALTDAAPTDGDGEATEGAETALDVASVLRRSPILGGGPREGEDATLDNEYLAVAARYGLFGLVAYLALWTGTALTGLRRARDGNALAPAIVGIVGGVLLFNLVAGSLYQLQLMALFWPLAGVLLATPDHGRADDDPA